ncbi:hypothetical protein AKJ09_05473 [Labilithrix luteola]|uniref:Aminoglycoside phosphotransferase domain-containing protein n=1 Tax=Labilithrix luteola TaxID=1391654 RepID=A0A0K1Q090_9BACT|nr:aminoglycoside phosphotransferase family protein [Labilithrix luteola]AKU98809.1 hypothetical protein AKJ09_05473 [Labilithrix luteola]
MTSQDLAIDEVRRLAAELEFPARPELLADKSNLVLRLIPEEPHERPLVARVAMATSMVRVGMEWLKREIEVSRFLAGDGVSVTRPSTRIEPGPHERNGLVISFWELEDLLAARVDPGAAGAELARAHRSLVKYPKSKLPLWGGFDEAREVHARAVRNASFDERERRTLEDAWHRAEDIIRSAPSRTASFQAVHGDAHIGNVLATSRGAVWTDWEDAFLGPVEWDMACLQSRLVLFGEERASIEAMTAAYDAPYDRDLARDLGLVRNVQVIVWLAVFAERQPELLERMRARIARLE